MLTTAGTVEVFEYQLNGAVDKKPIKSSCCLRIQTSAGSVLPVLACQLTDQDKLTVMYGTAVCPGFDHVSLVCYPGHHVIISLICSLCHDWVLDSFVSYFGHLLLE